MATHLDDGTMIVVDETAPYRQNIDVWYQCAQTAAGRMILPNLKAEEKVMEKVAALIAAAGRGTLMGPIP